MIRNKYIEIVCILICVVALILTIFFINGSYFGITSVEESAAYENELFDDSKVHTLDIEIDEDDWDDMIQNYSTEEYVTCDVTIDGETFNNVAIRVKGNSSLSTVARMDSERFSFKVEFDHYDDNTTYYGLDKLSLNNTVQDTTYMKDYISYHMMNEMGIAAPLSSFVNISVNGETFGLYLAVEGVEESFAERNYGNISGNLYKPENKQVDRQGQDSEGTVDKSASLTYTDDELESYNSIWEGAVFDYTEADQNRLIESLEKLNAGEDLDTVVDIESVLKYFVVHNFTDNFDSYTGNMQHNYYLYEEDGQLSVIPWDYNLAFGTFSDGIGMEYIDNATTMVNFPIDTPVLGTTLDDRPLLGKLLEVPEYSELYHQYFDEFISEYFESGRFEEEFNRVVDMISDYVKDDPTAFYSYEEFENGTATLEEFCLLRAESIRGQLDGSIPSTDEGQSSDSSSLINADHLTLSDMGTTGGGGADQGDMTERPGLEQPQQLENTDEDLNTTTENVEGDEQVSIQPMEQMSDSADNLQPDDLNANEPPLGAQQDGEGAELQGDIQNGNMPLNPDNLEEGDMQPDGDFSRVPNGQGRDRAMALDNQNSSEPTSGTNVNNIYLMLASFVVLIFGTVFVIKYKRF